jgi:hypothetical protein
LRFFGIGFLGCTGERRREKGGKLEWGDGIAPGDRHVFRRMEVSNQDDLVGWYGVLCGVPREKIRSGSDVSLLGHVIWCNERATYIYPEARDSHVSISGRVDNRKIAV